MEKTFWTRLSERTCGEKNLSEEACMSQGRELNIELLRIVLMFMVILLHFNNDDMGVQAMPE